MKSQLLIKTKMEKNKDLWLVGLILHVPINNFAVMPRRVFLGRTSTKQRVKCLAQGYSIMTPPVVSLTNKLNSLPTEPCTPQGSYRQVCVKFKDFSRTSKRLSYCFQGLKTYEKY